MIKPFYFQVAWCIHRRRRAMSKGNHLEATIMWLLNAQIKCEVSLFIETFKRFPSGNIQIREKRLDYSLALGTNSIIQVYCINYL